MTNIKAGYQLHITTWENDADNYKTETINGLTKGEVKYLISVAKLFYSENGRNCIEFGNSSCSNENRKKLWESFKKIPVPDDVSEYWILNDINELNDAFICRLIGIWNEGSLFRVYDSFKVYYIPEEVLDVTSEFKLL